MVAIDYTGRFWIESPGRYDFNLVSDDGSVLYIDRKMVIDSDGVHAPLSLNGSVKLTGGTHRIRVLYFQGLRFQIALLLEIRDPKDRNWKSFTTDEFKPPSDPANWKYGTITDLKDEQPNNAGRAKLKDVLNRK